MRQKLILVFAAIAAGLLAWDLYRIAYSVPDEVIGVPFYKIMYFHVPSGILSLSGFFVAMLASLACVSWNPAMGRPHCTRALANPNADSKHARAAPIVPQTIP